MKILIYTTSVNLNPHNGILLDEAEKYIREGHEVVYILCDMKIGVCLCNPLKRPEICTMCKLQHNFLLNKLSQKIRHYSLSSFLSAEPTTDFKYDTLNDVSNIYYKGIDIGMSSVSTYVCITRNLNPKNTPEFRKMMNCFLKAGAVLTDAFDMAVEKLNPDRICLFNGRLFETRAIIRTGQKRKIETYVYEVTSVIPSDAKKIYFVNTLPHDIQYNTRLINDLWDNSVLSYEEKEKRAGSFYEKKRAGLAVIDKSYTATQETGKLPENWNREQMNIVIFNSSEDEFFAIGGEYSEKLFPSQIDGIRHILENNLNNRNIHFFVRIHPNLKDIKYSYHLDILKFQQYDNCDVIPADSPISTYTLIDNADKIVVFGSSVGIEACFWKKPVILLAASFYKYLDIAWYPASVKELQKLILLPELQPRNREGALRYGYFALGDRGEKCKYFDCHTRHDGYKTLFGSKYLYKLVFYGIFQILKLLKILKQRLPVDGE
jgi:hypothetical protein